MTSVRKNDGAARLIAKALAWRVLGALLAGCLAAVHPAARAAAQDRAISVVGVLTDEGVLCRALRGNDGVLYTFRRNQLSDRFQPGDRIRIEGTVAPVSICQQGTTIAVTRAENAQ